MSNFELIDDYLTNRLGKQEKVDFERQLGSDPTLKEDVDLQRHILEGVKKARVADLKTMLNNVPVGGGFTSGIATGKIAAAVVTAGLVGVSLYFYFKPAETRSSGSPVISEKVEPVVSSPAIKDSDGKSEAVQQPVHKQPVTVAPKVEKNKPLRSSETVKPAATQQPKLEVVDPSEELVNNSAREVATSEGQKSVVTLSHITVETNSTNKKYTFHYQFKDGNLVLYGSFDKSLYEILEIHGDSHAVFLFYKESYYLLNEKQNNISPLAPIKDARLLRKLKEYRGR